MTIAVVLSRPRSALPEGAARTRRERAGRNAPGKTVRILKSVRQPGRHGSYHVTPLFVEDGHCFAQCADGSVLRIIDLELAGQRLEPLNIETALGPHPLPLHSEPLV